MITYEIQTLKPTKNGLEVYKQTLQSYIPLMPVVFKKAEDKIKKEMKENFYIKVFRNTKKGQKIVYDGNKEKK